MITSAAAAGQDGPTVLEVGAAAGPVQRADELQDSAFFQTDLQRGGKTTGQRCKESLGILR